MLSSFNCWTSYRSLIDVPFCVSNILVILRSKDYLPSFVILNVLKGWIKLMTSDLVFMWKESWRKKDSISLRTISFGSFIFIIRLWINFVILVFSAIWAFLITNSIKAFYKMYSLLKIRTPVRIIFMLSSSSISNSSTNVMKDEAKFMSCYF